MDYFSGNFHDVKVSFLEMMLFKMQVYWNNSIPLIFQIHCKDGGRK